MISLFEALVLGVVEGLTEFLPVSSTGHLILASAWLGLDGEAVKSFEVAIQAGALGAILWLCRERVLSLFRAVKADPAGLRLLRNLVLSFIPAATVGLLFHDGIKERLFGVRPVAAALAAGGVLMIVVERFRRPSSERTIDTLTPKEALMIGFAQCFALWPGTSRSMVTIVAGLLVGLPATAAAEYSFLLAIPTLGAATFLEIVKEGESLLALGAAPLAAGFLASGAVAVLAVKGFVLYLNKRGLAPFGWYRLGLSAAILFFLSR